MTLKNYIVLILFLLICGCATKEVEKWEIKKPIHNKTDIKPLLEFHNKSEATVRFYFPKFNYEKDFLTEPQNKINFTLYLKKAFLADLKPTKVYLNSKSQKLFHSDEYYWIIADVSDLKGGLENRIDITFDSERDYTNMYIYDSAYDFTIGTFYPPIEVSFNFTKNNNELSLNYIFLNKGSINEIPKIEIGFDSNFEDDPYLLNNYPFSSKKALMLKKSINVDGTVLATYRLNISQKTLQSLKFQNEGLVISPYYSYLNITKNISPIFVNKTEKNCKQNSDCSGSEICQNYTCKKTQLHLVFVPINWNNSELKEFDKVVDKEAYSIIQSLPSLSECIDDIKITKIKSSYDFEIDPFGSLGDLKKVKEFAMQFVGSNNFSYVIGIIQKQELYKSLGYVIPSEPNTILMTNYLNSAISPHEFGHLLGLNDEYCYNPPYCGGPPNELSAEYGCNPIAGDCCWEDEKILGFTTKNSCTFYSEYNTILCCHGNKNKFGGRSIMSYANAEEPRYHDEPSLKIIEKVLRCKNGDKNE